MSRSPRSHRGVWKRIGICNSLQEAADELIVIRVVRDTTYIQAHQICRSAIEILTERFIESTIGVVIDIAVEQVCDVLEVALSFCGSIAVGRHLEDADDGWWSDQSAAVVGNRMPFGVLEH